LFANTLRRSKHEIAELLVGRGQRRVASDNSRVRIIVVFKGGGAKTSLAEVWPMILFHSQNWRTGSCSNSSLTPSFISIYLFF
jgi:hypothetical protein